MSQLASDWSDVTILASDWSGAGPGSAGRRVESRVRVELLQRGEAGVTQRADVGADTVHHLGVGVQMLKQEIVSTGSTSILGSVFRGMK